MHYYLIHALDYSRKYFMENQFQQFGITNVKWINYPNKSDDLPDVCSSNLPKGMISCTYKHYLALKDIVENGYDYAVIMEDNIEFRGNVPEALSRYLKDLPSDWDCVFDSDYYKFKYIESDTTNVSVYKKSNNITAQCNGSSKGAHFIFLNQKAAKKLYDNFLPFSNSSDHHYNELFRKLDMIVYWAEEPNVHKINRPSSWKRDVKIPKKFSWLK